MLLKGPDEFRPNPIPRPFPPPLTFPPTGAPVTIGSLLATNQPNATPIKTLPWEIVAAGRVGAADGWATLEAAEHALAAITQGATGAAAIVRDGGRFLGYSIDGFGLAFDDDFQSTMRIDHPLRGRGGIFWRNDSLVAVVDGTFVERFDA